MKRADLMHCRLELALVILFFRNRIAIVTAVVAVVVVVLVFGRSVFRSFCSGSGFFFDFEFVVKHY